MILNKNLRALIFFLFFISGVSGLIYEILWARILTSHFGSSNIANSIIISVFMGGLALGSYISSQHIYKLKKISPILIYSLIEFFIAISALISFYTLPLLSNFYINNIDLSGTSYFIVNLIRFFLVATILLIPTTFMGMTLPVITQIIINDSSRKSKFIGFLYSINTFGAIIGVILSGFYLILNYGINNTFYLAILLNSIIGIIFLIIYFQNKNISIKNQYIKSKQLNEANIIPNKKFFLIILIIYAISGFISMALEVVWIRALIFFVGSSTYAFSIILVVFLFGIALGSGLSSILIHKLKRSILAYSLLEFLLGFSILISIIVIHYYSFKLLGVDNNIDPIFLSSINSSITDIFILTFLIIIVPTLIMGSLFPVVNNILLNEKIASSYVVGKVYAANTFGTIIGSVFCAFILIPFLGVSNTLLLFCLLSSILGLILILIEKDINRKYKLYTILPVLFFLLIMIISPINLRFKSDTEKVTDKILFYKEDPAATVSVFEDENGFKSMSINGMMIGGNQIKSLRKEIMLAHLPLLFHSNPQSVLTIGLGTGITLGDISLYNPKTLECVEIIDAVKEASKLFKEDNLNVVSNQKAKIYIEDGRNFLLTNKKKYDVIIDDSMLRRESAGNGPLYASEYYNDIKKSLNPNGLFCQWVPLYLNKEIYRTILNTTKLHFKYITLWYIGHAAVIQLASNDKINIDLNKLKSKLENPQIKNRLKKIEYDDPIALLKCFLLDNDQIERICKNSKINSDNNPIVEFKVPLETSSQNIFADNLLEMAPLRPLKPPFIFSSTDEKDINSLSQKWNNFHFVLKSSILHHLGKNNESFNELIKAYEVDSTDKHVKYFLGIGNGEPDKEKAVSYVKIGDYYRSINKIENAIYYYNIAYNEYPYSIEALNSLSQTFFETGKIDKAIDYGEKAIAIQPDNVYLLYNLGTYYEEAKNYTRAQSLYLKCTQINPLFEPAKQKIK